MYISSGVRCILCKLYILRTGVASDGSVRYVGVLERVGVRRRRRWTDARPVATGEEESTAALLDQAARQPAQQEELARVRVADLGVAEEDATVALRHFIIQHDDTQQP